MSAVMIVIGDTGIHETCAWLDSRPCQQALFIAVRRVQANDVCLVGELSAGSFNLRVLLCSTYVSFCERSLMYVAPKAVLGKAPSNDTRTPKSGASHRICTGSCRRQRACALNFAVPKCRMLSAISRQQSRSHRSWVTIAKFALVGNQQAAS